MLLNRSLNYQFPSVQYRQGNTPIFNFSNSKVGAKPSHDQNTGNSNNRVQVELGIALPFGDIPIHAYFKYISNTFEQQQRQSDETYDVKQERLFGIKINETKIVKAKDLYDFELESQSLLGLMPGWKFKMNENILTDQSKVCNMSFLGQFNQGKTHWANKVGKYNLDKGLETETKLVCLKQITSKDNLQINIIDCGGKGRAFRLYKELDSVQKTTKDFNAFEFFKTVRNDRYGLEDLIERFILKISNVVVIVAGHLKEQEQTFIMKQLNSLSEDQLKEKYVVILHNFRETKKFNNLQDRITTDIKECFKVDEEKVNREQASQISPQFFDLWQKYSNKYPLCFYNDYSTLQTQRIFEGKHSNVIHLATSYEDSFSASDSEQQELANYYNAYALHKINQLAQIKQNKKFDIRNELVQFLEQNISKYMKINAPERKNEKLFVLDRKNHKICLKLDPIQSALIKQPDGREEEEIKEWEKVPLEKQKEIISQVGLRQIYINESGWVDMEKQHKYYLIEKKDGQIYYIESSNIDFRQAYSFNKHTIGQEMIQIEFVWTTKEIEQDEQRRIGSGNLTFGKQAFRTPPLDTNQYNPDLEQIRKSLKHNDGLIQFTVARIVQVNIQEGTW